jgi:hypothetical protein
VTLALRPIGQNDYNVIEAGERIGRIRYAGERSPGIWIWVTVWWVLAGGPAPLAAVLVRTAMVALVGTVLVWSFLFSLFLSSPAEALPPTFLLTSAYLSRTAPPRHVAVRLVD